MKNLHLILKHHRLAFVSVLFGGLAVNAAMTLLNPLFLKYIFDEGIQKKDPRLFVTSLFGFVVLATICRFLNMAYSLRVQKLKNAILRSLTTETLQKYYGLPYSEVLKRDGGYFASRIYDEPLAASGATIDLALEIANAGVSFIVAFSVVAFLSGKATAILVACVPFLMFLAHNYGATIRRHAQDEKEDEGKLRGYVAQAARAYRSVNMFGLHQNVSTGLGSHFESYLHNSYARLKNTCVHNTLGSVFLSYGEMLVTLVCGYEIIHGRLTFGGFMAFMNAFWMAVGHMRVLIQKAPEVSKNSAQLDRLREFEALSRTSGIPPCAEDSLTFENVRFRYGEKEVLSDLSFTVRKGERAILSGKNGSGKSTIANILSGFLAPETGRVRTFGIKRMSACVSPHHFIPGTIKDNVGYGALSDGDRHYLEALAIDFELGDCLDRDPAGLSLGQQKKVELIMGLMKEADFYLFDEPLANVDIESKAKIMRRILERTRGKTLIVVMHGDDEFKEEFDLRIELPLPGLKRPDSRPHPTIEHRIQPTCGHIS